MGSSPTAIYSRVCELGVEFERSDPPPPCIYCIWTSVMDVDDLPNHVKYCVSVLPLHWAIISTSPVGFPNIYILQHFDIELRKMNLTLSLASWFWRRKSLWWSWPPLLVPWFWREWSRWWWWLPLLFPSFWRLVLEKGGRWLCCSAGWLCIKSIIKSFILHMYLLFLFGFL